MAPAKKKQRLQLVESKLSAGEGHEKKRSGRVPPVSILKDIVAAFPSVKPLAKTDETEQLTLRRKTYCIHGADTSEENEPCVIHHAQVETSNIMDDKIRRLTYVVTPFPHDHAESPLMNCSPGIEMAHSEMEITGIQFQPPILQDLKPKKRGGKKSVQVLQDDSTVMAKLEKTDDKKENESLPAGGNPRKRGLKKKSASSKNAQVKTLESENGIEIPTVKAKGRRKKAQGQENETIPTGSKVQKKPRKKGIKKNSD